MEKFPSFFFRQFWSSNNSRPCKLATSVRYSSVLSKTSIAPFTIYPYSLAVHTDEPAYQSTPIIIRLIRPRSRFKYNGPSRISLRYPQKLKQYPIYSTIYFFFSRNVWRFDSYLPILTIDESPFHATRLVITREMGGGRGMVENICRWYNGGGKEHFRRETGVVNRMRIEILARVCI